LLDENGDCKYDFVQNLLRPLVFVGLSKAPLNVFLAGLHGDWPLRDRGIANTGLYYKLLTGLRGIPALMLESPGPELADRSGSLPIL